MSQQMRKQARTQALHKCKYHQQIAQGKIARRLPSICLAKTSQITQRWEVYLQTVDKSSQ